RFLKMIGDVGDEAVADLRVVPAVSGNQRCLLKEIRQNQMEPRLADSRSVLRTGKHPGEGERDVRVLSSAREERRYRLLCAEDVIIIFCLSRREDTNTDSAGAGSLIAVYHVRKNQSNFICGKGLRLFLHCDGEGAFLHEYKFRRAVQVRRERQVIGREAAETFLFIFVKRTHKFLRE